MQEVELAAPAVSRMLTAFILCRFQSGLCYLVGIVIDIITPELLNLWMSVQDGTCMSSCTATVLSVTLSMQKCKGNLKQQSKGLVLEY